MKQEMRSLVAVGLSVAVFIVWHMFFAPKPAQKPEMAEGTKTAVVQQTESNPAEGVNTNIVTSNQQPATSNITDPQINVPVKITVIENDIAKVELTNDGGVPVSWKIKKYLKGYGENEEYVDMIMGGESPLLVSDLNNSISIPEKPRFEIVRADFNSVVYRWKSKKVEVTKEYSFDPESYLVDIDLIVKNVSADTVSPKINIGWSAARVEEKKGGFLSFLRGPQNILSSVYYLNGKTDREKSFSGEGQIYWAGVEDRYFLSAIIPRGQGGPMTLNTSYTKDDKDKLSFSTNVALPATVLSPGREIVQKYTLYVGPKEIGSLKSVGVNLDKAINYGWFSVVAIPILHVLKFFYKLIHNYGIAIIFLTILAKLIMHPLSKKSMQSMKAMQKLQPKIKELKEKYGNDKERLNMETMQLFKTHKVNPMGGCLPMIVQLPIYIALYKVLWNSIELYRAPFFWFYKDLSQPDPYYIMPVLLGATMWLQQRMMPSATADASQAKMMQIMPVMFTAFMLFLPSGLVFYILINTLMSIIQQWMTNNDVSFRDLLRGRFPKFGKAKA